VSEAQPRVLDDLFDIPDQVLASQFVVNINEQSASEVEELVDQYVVTEQLAEQFSRALRQIKAVVESGKSEATYVDGSFGSGKSHFLAVLAEVINGNPAARRKNRLASLVSEHDSWLQGKKFLQVKMNLVDEESLASAVFKGYSRTVRAAHPEAPIPPLLRDAKLFDNARDIRRRVGDEMFIAELGGKIDAVWGGPAWTTRQVDAAMAAPPQDKERKRLVSDLLGSWLSSYADTVKGESYVPFDEGLSVMSAHAKDLGYDGIILLLDELVLWLSGMLTDQARLQREAQSVSRLVEAEDWPRPIPIISFVPRQRDLQDLVGRDATGAETESLFETLDHWKGRFNLIELADQNLPEIVRQRVLRPKNDAAKTALAAAFAQTRHADDAVRDVLLDAAGESSDMASFEKSYPFSPVFLHVIVDVAEALQRQRSGIKLLNMLMGDYRHTLPVGQLMPVGAIFGKLIDGNDEPVGRKLLAEFNRVKGFYKQKVRPWLLDRHKLTEATAAELPANSQFAGDDLIVKTLLLSALTPGVPALNAPNVSRVLALNHGAVGSPLPGMDRRQTLDMLQALAAQFGEFKLGSGDDPTIGVNLIDVNIDSIIDKAREKDNAGNRQRLVQRLLWSEIGLKNIDEPESVRTVPWRGTARTVEVRFTNIRETQVPKFMPDRPGAVLVLVDYPFDEGNHVPNDDLVKIEEAQRVHGNPAPLTAGWLPSFLSYQRINELADLTVIDYVLERPARLDEYGAHLTSDERQKARIQLKSRADALRARLLEALKGSYGIGSKVDPDVQFKPSQHLKALPEAFRETKPPAGFQFGPAFDWIVKQLLDAVYPRHPDLSGGNGAATTGRRDLERVLAAVIAAKEAPNGRLEIERSEQPVLKRIANPLGIAQVSEVWVRRGDWYSEIDRAIGGAVDAPITIATLRNTIDKLHPGLTSEVRDLLVRCYAVDNDRAWYRGGVSITAPGMNTELSPEMELRSQALPGEADFRAAEARAVAIFGAAKRPARSFRAVDALARQIKDRVQATNPAIQQLREELARHADVLALGDEAPRAATVAELNTLYADLSALADPTAILEGLARADLPKDAAIYKAAVNSAAEVNTALANARWNVLGKLVARSSEGLEAATSLLHQLRRAAAEEELAQSLAPVLRTVQDEAFELLTEPPAPDPPVKPVAPTGGTTPKPDPKRTTGEGTKRVRAADAGGELARVAGLIEDEGGVWEVTWRRVE
jgi:hypothetical protein